MKLASVAIEDGWAVGLVCDDLDSVRVLDPVVGTVDDVVRGFVSSESLRAAAEDIAPIPIVDVRLGPPVQRFNRDVLCTGWNYLDHFYESAGKREGQDPHDLPARPTFFTKGPDTVVGPFDPIAYDDALSSKWDYEAEVALVIGKDGRSIAEEDASDHIFGYLVANDISQRDLQRAHGGQWLKGKSIDQTMPLGPWLTTADEIKDLGAVRITCEVNGEVMQDATLGEMAFSPSRLIAELSSGMTLRAGDIVLTGTPSGIGNAREPAVFLTGGDVVVTRASSLGELRNTLTSVSLLR